MAEQNFRVQFLRGSTAENNSFTGREGELTIDLQEKRLRVHDGVTAGGEKLAKVGDSYSVDQVDTLLANLPTGGGSNVTVAVVSWAGAQYTLPAGVTVEREYSDSSLKIHHQKNAYPVNWFAFNRESSPMTGILPSSTRNLQIVDLNTVIITNVSSFERFDITLNFA